MKRNFFVSTLIAVLLAFGAAPLQAAEEYVIDTKDAHAFIQFRIQHLGFSWLSGRFNRFDGSFTYDEKNPAANRVVVNIDPASIDSNHAERDKHLRGSDFLYVSRYPSARFESTAWESKGDGKAVLHGKLTLRGVTRPVAIEVTEIGAGRDPWGGYRRGFEGRTNLTLADFNIAFDLGPAAREVELMLSVEGIRK
ncbi:MAG: YceI family protein [Ectothiorhodospiraceae bacterium]|jgi:polyisoprenoid-binding protein YceI|nr:YceI family protein [Ectothiorhodospiraceae bacterium]